MPYTERPTYRDLVILLETAPAREAISDQRYWDWRRKVDDALQRIEPTR